MTATKEPARTSLFLEGQHRSQLTYYRRTFAITPPLEELLGIEAEPRAEVLVGVPLAEAGMVCATFAVANLSKHAVEVACPQQESIRD